MPRLAFWPLLILPAVCAAASPEAVLSQRYKQFNQCLLTNSGKSMTAWVNSNCSPKFSYTSYQKNTFGREAFLKGMVETFAKTTKVLKSTVDVRFSNPSKIKIVATVDSDYKGQLVFDSKTLTITDQSQTVDTWMLIGKAWKLTKVVQVKSNTQMHDED